MEHREYILNGPKPTYPLADGTVGRFFFNCLKKYENVPTCITEVETGRTISYKELLRATCQLAICFKMDGYGIGTVMCICSENSIYYLQSIIAAWYIGITVAPVNHNYNEREFIHLLNVSKPSIILCSKKTLETFLKLKRKLPYIKKIILLDGDRNLYEADTLNSFTDRFTDFDYYKFQTDDFDREEHVAVVLCSSGTTGLPKKVMLTDKGMMIRFNQTLDPHHTISNHLNPEDAALVFLPLFHGYGFAVSLGYLIRGIHLILMQMYKEELCLNSIGKYQVRSISLVPSLMITLIKSPNLKKYNLSSLTEVTCGGAPVSEIVLIQTKQKLNVSDVRQGYGLTESTVLTLLTPVGNRKYFSVGRLLPFTQVKVLNVKTNMSLPPNEIGEICVGGDTVMKGYMGNLKATKNAIDEQGWLHTGDLGYYDEEGYFYIIDRRKELIKYNAFQVAPAELETLLLNYPGILEAAVVGKPDLFAGELPTAFIVTDLGGKVSEKEIQEYIKLNASKEKQLRGGVYFVDSLPKTTTGKINKKELREILKKSSKL